MASRSARSEQRRQQILEEAYPLFLKNGFHGTSVRQIARRAGIALGNIYNHFESKEAVFTAVLDAFHPYHQILPAIQAAEGETVEAFVQDAARQMVAHLGRRPDFLKLMFIELVEFEGGHMPHLIETIFPQLSQVIARFTDADAQPGGDSPLKGRLRPLSPPILIRAFLGLFFSYYITQMLFSKYEVPLFQPDALDQFVDIFLHGILAPGEPVAG